MVTETSETKVSQNIFLRLRKDPGAVTVDIRCGTRVADVTLDTDIVALPADVQTLEDEALKSLGLLLLGNIARNIEHIHINNFAFISFRIPTN